MLPLTKVPVTHQAKIRWCHKGGEVTVGTVLGFNGDRRRSHESLLDRLPVIRHPERFLGYRSSKGNGLLSTRSKLPGASSPPIRRCCRNWAEWPGPLFLYSGFGGLSHRLSLSTRSKWPGASSPPLGRCCLDRAGWPGPLLLLHSSFGELSRRLDLSRQGLRLSPLSPRMRCRASRRSHLAQGGPTNCRSQGRSEDGLGRSGRCR